MAEEDDDFQFIYNNFPPDPPEIDEGDKVTCDLTRFDAPPQFPFSVCSRQDLQVLKLFVDNFPFIPKELGNLVNLEHLVLCRCENEVDPDARCIKIPCTLKNLKNLRVLDLRNNPLGTFPQQITELLNLEELHLSNCTLLGVPDELALLQSLKTLDLSSNMFSTLPIAITQLRNLNILYLSDGQLQSLCGEIKNLVNLERLQLTNNNLSSLPEGLFELVNLKKLYLNSNKLTSLHENVANLVKLEYLVLNQNKLTKIPESIGKLKELRYLNLHENMLYKLPEEITNLKQIETLLIDNNPLQNPPVQVCNQGIQSICNYFQAKKNTKNIHAKRLKVVVLGESMAGKSSVVNALIKCDPTEIKEDDRTFGVVFFHWKPEPHVDELELMVVDCAGQRKYQMTHQLFLSEGALFILAVDLFRFIFEDEKCYQENIGQWISMVAARIPRARILIVPTHIDECKNEEEIDLKCRNILTYLKEQRQEMVREIEEKSKHIKKTEGRCIPSEELAKILEQHREQKDNLPIISLEYKDANDNRGAWNELKMNVIPVSNTSLEGTPLLRQELVRIARNKTLSPNVDIDLPESWVNIEKEIKKCRKNEDIPWLSIAKLKDVLNEQGMDVNEGELQSCVSYLHAIGELQYFKDISGLEKNVIINPYWLGSVLRQLFRHDMEEYLNYNECSRNLGVFPQQFALDKMVLLNSGVMSQVLLKCIWSKFLDDSDTIFPQLLTMLAHFGLACEIPAAVNDLDTPDGSPPPPCYLVPWFFKHSRPRSMSNDWPSLTPRNQIEVTVGFALLRYLPFGLFERFSVLCHRHEPQDYEHWQNGFYMKFDSVLIHSNIFSVKKCETLKVCARAPKDKLDDLWRTLLILLEEVQKLLNEWPGMNYKRISLCPGCIRREASQPYHFYCDWFKVHKRKTEKTVCRNKIDDISHEVRLDHLFPSEDVLNCYRNPRVEYSDEIPDCIVEEDLFDTIALSVGTDWTYLARTLGTKLVRVNSIKEEKRGNIREQAVEMLREWKQRLGSEAKVKVIITALRKMKLNEVADSVVQQTRASEHSEKSQ
ncbi:malignant fibrous histiocytoma-amplified sequence 1 homolog [Dendronephthya gigantea]|uniref:malignant fibrous histiocytoma-amplified sequence 1 homolog n=1 Tax=Dendronephthya gigantea TaxID=151771 RepID=UPI00106B87D5|nr:malignant fibrous histiocytoma-amplified sequence 1 homolog [Dendronephthya gigantea]